ncbi:hypothetical protein [Phaffia rhodozyma]|uniref:Uncharacterized protein n=1 Tax=Phaffia rhodozyma TaxID=264483 RepID=A0A0F7SJ73_PHARH|nr:hypothetical protein [Phaffia rhodozyma]
MNNLPRTSLRALRASSTTTATILGQTSIWNQLPRRTFLTSSASRAGLKNLHQPIVHTVIPPSKEPITGPTEIVPGYAKVGYGVHPVADYDKGLSVMDKSMHLFFFGEVDAERYGGWKMRSGEIT